MHVPKASNVSDPMRRLITVEFTHRQRIAFLASVAAITSLGIDMSLPGIPGIETAFGAHVGQGTLSVSFFTAGFAATPLIGGPLSDSFGRSRILTISLCAFAVAGLACASAGSLPTLFLFRLVQGCTCGIATTLPLAIVQDLLTGTAARQAMSEVSALGNLMPIVAPMLGNWAVHLGGWRTLFAVQAAIGGCVAALSFLFPDSKPAALRRPFKPLGILQSFRKLISVSTLRNCAFVYGLLFACTFCFTAVSPLILIQRLGMHGTMYSLVFALNSAGSILGGATSAILCKRHVAAHRVIYAGLLIAAISTLSALLLQLGRQPVTIALLFSVFLALFGFNLAGPSLLVEALQPVPELLGSGSGMIRCIFMLMNSTASGALGLYCSRHVEYTEKATSLSMAVLAIAAILLYTRFFLAGHRHLVGPQGPVECRTYYSDFSISEKAKYLEKSESHSLP